jgi:hypothetical protein
MSRARKLLNDEAQVWVVESPDGLPIDTCTYRSRKEAFHALIRWCQRFETQGYYAAVGRRIALADLPAQCTVREKRGLAS